MQTYFMKEYASKNVTIKDTILLGSYPLIEDEDMIIETANRYYNWLLDILNTTQTELEAHPDFIDFSFKQKVLTKIKLQFFPRYSDLERLFQKGTYYRNENLSGVKFWPQNEESREHIIRGHKLSKDLYRQLIKGKATPYKLEEALKKKVPVEISTKEMQNHTFLVSRTDTGKSTLILELAKNIMDKKEGSLVLLEPHGDISQDLARLCKNEDDLVYIDPFLNPNYSVTINIFDMKEVTQANISKYGALILNTFKQIIGSDFSVAMHSILNPMIAVLLQIPNSSFYDMLRFLNDDENSELLEYAKQHALVPSHRLFFQKQFSESRYSITKFSIASKLNILLQDSIFSNLLTGKSTIDLQELINTPGKVIIIRLNTIKMIETIKPIGRFLIALIVSYAFQRENIPQNKRISTHLMIDEASMFLGDSIELILAQARKFRLYLLMAIQNNSQLPTSIESSILSNTAIKLVGMNSHKNHSIMSKELNISMDALFSLQQKGEFFLKVGNKKAVKFRVTDRLFNRKYYLSSEQFSNVKSNQIQRYYRHINLMDIEYADIQNFSLEYSKPYSKNATQELLENVTHNNNELLDY